MLEIPALRLLLQLAHGGRFHVEDPHGFAPFDEVQRGGIMERIEGGVIQPPARVLFHGGQRIANDGQGPVAKQIDFYQPGFLRLVLFPLNDPHPLGAPLRGHVAGNPVGRQNDAAAVHRKMPRERLQPRRQTEDLRPRGIERKSPELGMLFHPLPHALRVGPEAHPPGYFLDLGGRNPVDLGHFPNRRPCS